MGSGDSNNCYQKDNLGMHSVLCKVSLYAFEEFKSDQNHQEEAEDLQHFLHIEKEFRRFYEFLEQYDSQFIS